MRTRIRKFHGAVSLALFAMLALLTSATPSLAQNSCPLVIPNGRAYEKLAADWWKWTYSLPASINPILDDTGAQAYLGGQGYVFFLTGSFSGTATRTVTVPAGKPLFFPLVNVEFDNVLARPPIFGGPFTPPAAPLSVPGLYADAADVVGTVIELHASVDACAIPNLTGYRAISSPFSFALPPTGNIFQEVFGIDVAGTVAPVVADGYWLFIAPLSAGQHIVKFGGTFGPPNNFVQDITYYVTVMP
jgi:hypothetical protein